MLIGENGVEWQMSRLFSHSDRDVPPGEDKDAPEETPRKPKENASDGISQGLPK